MTSQVSSKFRPLGSCLLNLPAPFIAPFVDSFNLLVQNVVVKVSGGSQPVYCGWTGFYSASDNVVEMDPEFAAGVDIKEGSMLNIHYIPVDDLSALNSAELIPQTVEDWELTELYASVIEDRFLNQVRALVAGQTITVYPNGPSNPPVKYTVKKLESPSGTVDYGLLSNHSELHIEPKLRKLSPGRPTATEPNAESAHPSIRPSIFRSVALPNPFFGYISRGKKEYCVYANLNGSKASSKLFKLDYVKVSLAPGPGTPERALIKQDELDESLKPAGSIVARLVDDPQAPARTIGLSEPLAVALGVEKTVGEQIVLEQVESTPLIDSEARKARFIIHKIVTKTPKSTGAGSSSEDTRAARDMSVKIQTILKDFFGIGSNPMAHVTVTDHLKLPMITPELPLGGILEISYRKHKTRSNTVPDEPLWYPLHSSSMPVFELGVDTLQKESFVQDSVPPPDHGTIVARDAELRKATRSLGRYIPTVVYGASGSGKTLLCQTIGDRLSHAHGFYVKYIDANELVSTTSQDNLKRKFLDSTIQELVWHQPSLLILENLEALASKEPEQSTEPGFSSQMTELLSAHFAKIRTVRQISLLFTAPSRDALNPLVFQKHLVETEISLSAPNKDQRFHLLEHFVNIYPQRFVSVEDKEYLRNVAADTEGYLPFDLKNLCGRAYHELISFGDAQFAGHNFDRALKGYTPASLRGVKLQKDTATSWKDIGGLQNAKQILLETLEWPTKYAPIFAKCSLRLRSGILLYGYPGCGKTLLASAVASQCGLHFISIKGPEILNKYIGASEQSVRELFERASAAKPCILFFDEFDSIAPKRGHDSTGVTDRIVNQLLTQMDGAEGLDGVYVLAATSRPDLIDAALLRPGRLDKSVLCDMPNFEDRLDILETIVKSGNFHLDPQVLLEDVAKKTSGFSGADLQAVVYNSYLKAVHENLDKTQADLAESDSAKSQQGLEYFVAQSAAKTAKAKVSQITKKMKDLGMRLNEKDPEQPEGCASPAQTTKKPAITISQAHFSEGLLDTNRSISAKEQKKFEQIYLRFGDNKREDSMPSGEASQDIGGRVSLM